MTLVDFQAAYNFKVGLRKLTVMVDIFNLVTSRGS
jgi:hypothetical protein